MRGLKAAWHPSGHRFFIRVYSGVLRPNSRAFNTGKDTKENIAKLFHVHADPNRGLEEVESAPAGDIIAALSSVNCGLLAAPIAS